MSALLEPSATTLAPSGPFSLDDGDAYQRWRERKLREYPCSVDELIVEVRDPRHLTHEERTTLSERCRRANMAVYAELGATDDKEIPRALGRQFGLERLDANWLADDDGISSIEVVDRQPRSEFIPYTDRPISWHTDGYYNTSDRCVRSLILHCVRPAKEGGENALLDHEIAYLLLRDQNPEHVRALSAPDVMTIPARCDDQGVVRAEQSGPVFSVDPATGRLHMRYTARTRSICWSADAATRAAIACLESILSSSPLVLRTRLQAGTGLLCSNVLHNRSGFIDAPQAPRRMYRARFHDELQFC
ncbi:MAG TPA: TauD/TfdA family dioxygenase [Burkholderiaceae bacterium]|nr:TauD/TfdA family dioxygenase [Burkholderiaceae bacterium]